MVGWSSSVASAENPPHNANRWAWAFASLANWIRSGIKLMLIILFAAVSLWPRRAQLCESIKFINAQPHSIRLIRWMTTALFDTICFSCLFARSHAVRTFCIRIIFPKHSPIFVVVLCRQSTILNKINFGEIIWLLAVTRQCHHSPGDQMYQAWLMNCVNLQIVHRSAAKRTQILFPV